MTKIGPLIHYNNLLEMVLNSKNRYNIYNKAAIRWIEKSDNTIQTLSFNELADSMTAVFYALTQMGFKKNDHIGICSESNAEWIITDLGIQALGGITIPIDPDLKQKSLASILEDSECKALFVDTLTTLKKIHVSINDKVMLKLIVIFYPKKQSINNSNLMTFDELLSLGEKQYHSSNRFHHSVQIIEENDVASIIYSANMRKTPRGIMLTHKNILSNVLAFASVIMSARKKMKPWKHHIFLHLL